MSRTLVSLFVLGCLPALAGCSGDDEKAKNPGVRLPIEACRLVSPESVDIAPGQSITATGRVLVPGLTDRTPAADPDPELLARFGWGPDGSEPNAPGKEGAWTWKAASAAPDWDGALAGDPDVDQYRATTTAPGAGTYDLAFAFSGDSGKTWTFCDLDGNEGEDNGYSPEQAGAMVIRSSSDPCLPDPCITPPPDTCLENAPVVYTGPGTCRPDGGSQGYTCDFPHQIGDACEAEPDEPPLVCFRGTCVVKVPVAFCQHLGPAAVTFAGEPIEFRGLVRVPGITDRTPGVDEDPQLLVRFGWGWTGTDPHPDTGWDWVDGEPIPDWTDETLEEGLRGADVYRATFEWDIAGTYDTAWRVSADGGATWTNCDLDGAGVDGGGYSTSQAGRLTVP